MRYLILHKGLIKLLSKIKIKNIGEGLEGRATDSLKSDLHKKGIL